MPSPRPRRPSIEALRALLALVEQGGVTAAAEKLGVKQPVVSRKLASFQDAARCGAVLLRRDEGKTELTAAGAAVLPAVRELVQRYDQLFTSLSGERGAPERMRIGVGQFAARYYLPLALARLADLFEECEFQSEILRGRQRILAVAGGNCDFAIVTHTPPLIQEVLREHGRPVRLQIERLGAQPMCVIASRKIAAGRALEEYAPHRGLPVEALRNWELVGLDHRSGIRQQLEQHFPNPGEIQFVAEGGGWWAIRECVRQGIGVGIIPLAVLTTDEKDLVIRKLSRQFAVEDCLIRRRDDLSPMQQRVRTALTAAAKQHRLATRQAWKLLKR